MNGRLQRNAVNKRNRRQARENACDQVAFGLVLHLIGWVGDASFLNQSQSEVKQNQSNSELHSIENRSVEKKLEGFIWRN